MSDFWHNRVNIDLKWPENETIIIIIYLFISSINNYFTFEGITCSNRPFL